MYGYLRLDTKSVPADIRRYYRKEYCSLCHALWSYYGFNTRFLLSYDLTFMAVLMNLDPQINFSEKKPICYFHKKFENEQDRWKKIAAISLLLSVEKLRDNIYDDNSIIARCIIKTLSKPIKKAERDYPELSHFLRDGFTVMNQIEKNKGSIEKMSDAFSDIIVGAQALMYGKFEFEDRILKYVAKWIYFIDAIDDLDKDFKNGNYNPFIYVAKSREELLLYHYDVLEKFIEKQFLIYRPIKFETIKESYRYMVIMNVLNRVIPNVTKNILLGQNSFFNKNILLKYIENKEDIIFA